MTGHPAADAVHIVLDDPPTASPAASGTATTSDGRQLRRLRNIEAVRQVILDMFEHREQPDLETIAARAGLTVRSLYRYHADLDAAVNDALQSRADHIYEVWDAQRLPDPGEPLHDRIAIMVEHRLALEVLGRPLRNTVQVTSPDPRFDAEVLAVFAPEFDRLDAEERTIAQSAVCFLLRPRQVRSMIEFPQHGGVAPGAIIAHTVRRLLDPLDPQSSSGE